jgi:protease PrsW
LPSWQLVLASVVAGASGIGWVAYFRWKDRHRPEPLWMMATAIAGGALGAGMALLGFVGLEHAGFSTEWNELGAPSWGNSLLAALRIGAVEETAKLLPLVPLAIFHRHFDELLDGIIYSCCSALGFALLEAAVIASQEDWSLATFVARAVASPLSHALFSAPAGLGLGYWALRGSRARLVLGFAAAVLLHAAYDLLLARPSLPPAAAAAVVLGCWVWLVRVTPRLAHLPAVSRS